MYSQRWKFVGVFALLFWLLKNIVLIAMTVSRPNHPPLHIVEYALRLLVLSILTAGTLAFFPVEEERLPVRTTLISIAIYLVCTICLLAVNAPKLLPEMFWPITKDALLTGALAGLSAFGARIILASVAVPRNTHR